MGFSKNLHHRKHIFSRKEKCNLKYPLFKPMAEVGKKVAVKYFPGITDGRPHPRYHGRTLEIIKIVGKCYLCKYNKVLLYVNPVHTRVLA